MPGADTAADELRMAAVPQAAALAGTRPRIVLDVIANSNDATQVARLAPGRWWRRRAVAVAAAIGLLIVAGSLFGLSTLEPEDQPTQTAGGAPVVDTTTAVPRSTAASEPPPVSPSAGPTPTASPSDSDSPTPSASAAPPGSQAPPTDPIAALRLAVQQQVSSGDLNPDKASDLYTKVDAIAHAVNAGNATDEAKNIKAFKDRLTALRTGGQLTAAGYNILNAAADAITETLP
jgi:hypothetical protein